MTSKETKGMVKISQELLFKRPYIWIVTVSITLLNFLITYSFNDVSIQHLFYFLVDVITTYVIIEFYAFGIRFLNKKVPLNKDFVKRLTYQLTLHTLIVIIFSILVNELFDFIFFKGERLSLSLVFYTKDTFVALLFILLFHAVYFGLFLMSNKLNMESLKVTPQPKIKVRDAFAFKLLNPEDIVAAYSLLGISYVVDTKHKKYISEITLKELELKLRDKCFRANRKYIFSKAIIESYKSVENGKIDVEIFTNNHEELSKTITVSRDKASAFRNWINMD